MIRAIFIYIVCFVFLNRAHSQTNFSIYFSEAAKSLDADDYNKAIEKFSKALDNKSEASNNYKIADAYIYRGYCRYKLKNYKSAINDMDEGLKLKPEYIKGYIMKTMVYLEEDKYEECIVWCNKGLEKKDNNDELLLTKSKALSKLKKYEEARQPLFIMLDNNPKSITAFRHLGSIFLQQKMWDSASAYYSKAIEIDPTDFISYYDRGISKSYTKDLAGATEDIQKAMQLDSTTKFIGYNNIGFYMKLEKKDFTGAIDFFNKAIELNPEFAYAYSNRGFAKLNLNDIKGAYKDLRKSIELDNTNSYAFKNLGLIYLKDGQKKSACDNFKKAAQLGYTEMYDEEIEKLLKENCN